MLRVYRVELLGKNGWFEDGKVTLKPGEHEEHERAKIASQEEMPCRLCPVHHKGSLKMMNQVLEKLYTDQPESL